jgi:hypothetical protein
MLLYPLPSFIEYVKKFKIIKKFFSCLNNMLPPQNKGKQLEKEMFFDLYGNGIFI